MVFYKCLNRKLQKTDRWATSSPLKSVSWTEHQLYCLAESFSGNHTWNWRRLHLVFMEGKIVASGQFSGKFDELVKFFILLLKIRKSSLAIGQVILIPKCEIWSCPSTLDYFIRKSTRKVPLQSSIIFLSMW